MKRLTLFAATTALILLLLISFVSCNDTLGTPNGLEVDIDNTLTWAPTDGAKTYVVKIRDSAGAETESKQTRKLSYSLASLEEGDYEISVRAFGNSDNEVSEWSEVLKFHRDYESGCIYEPINNNSEYSIVKAGSAVGKVVIESTYRGKPVTEIADNAFKGNRNITEIVLGDHIRRIGENAFYSCMNLVSVTLPDGLTELGPSAFQGCSALESVNIPDGITIIPNYCFSYCRSLASVTIGSNVISIGDSAFNGSALTSVVIPDKVKSIGKYAFSSINNLTEVTIGKSVTAIMDNAFREDSLLAKVTFAEGCELETIGDSCFHSSPLLTQIALPEKVTEIGSYCFYNCPLLESVTLPDSITRIGALAFNATKIYDSTETDFVYVGKWLVAAKNFSSVVTITADDIKPGTVGISDNCFKKAPLLESVKLPDSIKTIGRYTFAQAAKLSRFDAGTGLETLQTGAFNACTTLNVLNLNEGLTDIGDYVFYACRMLDNNAQRSIIPKSVTRIGVDAFKDTQLWSTPDENHIIYAGSHRTAWVVGFETDTPIGNAKLKSGAVGIADYAFMNCATLTAVEGLSSCINIGTGAFYGCEKLEAVSLHPRITEIKPVTFYKCSSLFKISFPTMLESIGNGAFYKCLSLSELDFSETLNFKSIAQFGFFGCQNLKTVEFGADSTLEEIGEYAFMYCKSLTGITLPEGIKEIKNYTFSHCTSLASFAVMIPGEANAPEGYTGITKIGTQAFYKCYSLQEMTIPDTVVSIGERAFYKCSTLKTLKLGSSLESIGDYAFYKASVISELHLPDSLASIGQFAFRGLAELNSVIIPNSVKTISANAFYGCSGATFYVEEGAQTAGWNLRWNSSTRPVVYGAVLSEDRTFVTGITIAEKPVENNINLAASAVTPLLPPEREGYTFSQWQRADGTVLNTYEIPDEPVGSTLTAVWKASE